MYWLFRYLLRLWRERQARAAGDGGTGYAAGDSGAAGGGPDPAPADALAAPKPRRVTRTASSGPRQRSAATRGPLGLLVHQVRYDLRASLRNPRARFVTFFFPILLLVIFNGVFGHGSTTVSGVHVKLSRYYVAGILAMSIVIATYASLVVSISTLRESGVLKRRRATPVPAVLLIAGQAITTVLTTAIMATLVLVIAKVFYGVGLAPGAIAALGVTAALGTLVFAALGYAVSGVIGSPEAAQPIVQATTMPLWFVSGVFIPAASLSATLRSVGSVFPIEHLANGMHLASVNSSFSAAISGSDLLVLAAWGVAALAFATWRFSWLPSTATA